MFSLSIICNTELIRFDGRVSEMFEFVSPLGLLEIVLFS